MKKSNFISAELSIIESKVYSLFDELVSNGKTFDFVKEVNDDKTLNFEDGINELRELSELHLLPTIEYRNDLTGNVLDIHVTKVTSEKIQVIKMEDEKPLDLKFKDLASIEDRLILLNEMETYLVDSN